MEKFKKHLRNGAKLLAVIILILYSSPALSQLADMPWPMFMHDVQHTGRSPYVGPDSIILGWSFQATGTNECISSSIGTDGTIYYYSNKLYALNSNGILKWTYEDDRSGFHLYRSSPTVGFDGTIYFGGDDFFFAINPNGTLKWKYEMAAGFAEWIQSACAITADGTIFVCGGNALYAINKNGNLIWKYEVGIIESSPSLANDGTIYFGCQDGYLYAINPNGTFKWKYKIASPSSSMDSSPSIGPNGTIYIGSTDRKIFAINPNGTLKWSISSGGNIVHTTPAIGSDSTIYVASTFSLNALDPKDGSKKWTYHLGNVSRSSPAIDINGTIYCAADKKFYAIKADGTLKWTREFTDKISSNPIIDSNGTIYIETGDGKLNALFQKADKTPDLIISNIVVSPINGATPGGEIEISASIQDLTGIASSHCKVSFYYDNNSNFIDSTTLFVPVGQTGVAQVEWETQNFEVKDYKIIAIISNSDPPESNTTNNESNTIYKLLPLIQPRIDNAQPGDTVWVEPGTYYEHITLRIGIVVKSITGSESTIIDGGGTGNVVSAPYLDPTAVLDGFTIRNGSTGIDITRGGCTLVNNIITENSRGLWMIGSYAYSDPVIKFNLFVGNTGKAIDANNSWADVFNNTFVGNGTGVYSVGFYQPSPYMWNNIYWNNGDDLGSTAKATYSCIQDGDAGTGNISADPLFVDANNGDYYLQLGSPCIDAGDPSSPNDPDGTRADMGAYYFDQSSFLAMIMGTVTDAITSTPIVGAMLVLSGPESDTSWSDTNGDYKFFTAPGTGYAIEVSVFDYHSTKKENITVIEGETTVVNFALQPDLNLAAPTNLQATASTGKVSLQWQAPAIATEEELALDDGSFEQKMGWDNIHGIAANGPFQPSQYPVSIDIARVAFSGEQAGDLFKVYIYLDPSGTADRPSSSMLAGTIGPLSISSSAAFQNVDLSSLNLSLNSGKFFIGVQQLGSQPMWILIDESGSGDNSSIDSNLDGIFTPLNELNPPQSGVFAIRAIVSSHGSLSQTLIENVTEVEKAINSTGINNNLKSDISEIVYLTKKVGRGRSPRIILAHTKPENNTTIFSTLTDYNLYRSQSSPVAISDGNRIKTVSQSVTSYDDTDVVAEQKYYYVVTAVYDIGESEPSNQVEVTVLDGTGPVVRINPASKEIQKNSFGTISVVVDSVQELGSFEFTIEYDPSVVQISHNDSVKLGEFLGSTGRSVMPVGPVIDNVNGEVTFGAFSFGSNPAPSIDVGGVLAVISWTAQDSGLSIINFKDVELTHPDGSTISNVVTVNGQIKVTTGFWADIDKDGDVDIVDIQLVAGKWNTKVGDPNYDPRCDVDNEGQGDGDIDVVDIQLVAGWWNKTLPAVTCLPLAKQENRAFDNLTLKLIPNGTDNSANNIIDVVVENANDLGAFQFDLVSSNSSLKIQDVQLAELLKNTGNNVMQLGPETDETANSMNFGAFSFGDRSGASGNGVLARIIVEAKTDAGQILSLENIKLTDSRGNLLPVDETASITVGSDFSSVVPDNFTLRQNYPNPFNPRTTISFGIPNQIGESVKVRLNIFNLEGKLVRILFEGEKSSGWYTVEWDGTNELGEKVTSGLYFYTVIADDYRATKKMVLTK